MNPNDPSSQDAFHVHSADRGISPVADGIGRRHWIGIATFLIVMTLIGIWCFRHGRAHSETARPSSHPPRAAVSMIKPSWLTAALSVAASEPLQVPPLPPAPVPATSPPANASPMPALREIQARQHSPILIVNVAAPASAPVAPLATPPAPAASTARDAESAEGSGERVASTPAEAYADRLRRFAHQSGAEGVPSASAQSLELDWRIAQGKLIHAVLETAMQSDLPGPLRAIVSESVFSENGEHLLIRPGSRLIGEYRAGLAMGATRVFVIWKRLLEPDGLSVALGSEGTDTLGRAGLTGTVDRHFLERFSTATLLSLIGSSTTAVQGNNSVVVNTAQGFGQVAQSAFQDLENLPPTVYVHQGTPVMVVVQRDLDFFPVVGGAPVTAARRIAVSLTTSGENFVALERFLEPLTPFLERDDVFEISINEPGLAFVETTAGSLPCPIPELTYDHLLTLAELIAHSTQQQISARHPLLSASLRSGDRVQVVRPPACESGKVVLSIRRHGVRDLSLEDYEAQGAFRQVAFLRHHAAPANALRRLLAAGRTAEFLQEAVRTRRNIIVSGGTGTGKTTFINALLRLLPEHERLVVIEDSREVHVRQRNRVHLLISRGGQGEAQITVQDLLEATLRLRPDRIMLGELRGAEAYSFLRAVNSGHPGSITSLHADSAERAFEQLVLMATPVARGLTGTAIADYARSVVDVVVQLHRCPQTGQRRVSEIRLREDTAAPAPGRRSSASMQERLRS